MSDLTDVCARKLGAITSCRSWLSTASTGRWDGAQRRVRARRTAERVHPRRGGRALRGTSSPAYCGVAHCVGVASGTAALTLRCMRRGHRAGRRGDRARPHVHRLRARPSCTRARRPSSATSSDGTGPHRSDAAAAAVTDADRGDPARAPLRPGLRHGRARRARASPRPARPRGRRPGARRDVGGRRAGSLGDAAASASIRARTSGRSATAARSAPTTPSIAARARQLRHLGQRRKGEHVEVGFNERLDGLQAALLRVKLPHLDGCNARAASARGAYRDGARAAASGCSTSATDTPVRLPPVPGPGRATATRPRGASQRDGIATGVHYFPAAALATAAWDGVLAAPRGRRCRPRPRGRARSCRCRCSPSSTRAEIERVARRLCRRRCEGRARDRPSEHDGRPARWPRRARAVLSVGVVGLGYWGPNLLRVLAETRDVEVRWICDLDAERLRAASAAAIPARAHDHGARRPARRRRASTRSSSPRRSSPTSSCARAACAPASTRSSRSRWRPRRDARRRARSSSPTRTDRVLMCGHTFLYSPAGARGQGSMLDARRARRRLLHLLEPREPRPAPARRQRHLGPRPARLLDPPVLARRDAGHASGRSAATRSCPASPTSRS